MKQKLYKQSLNSSATLSTPEAEFTYWLQEAPRAAYQLALAIKTIHWFIKGNGFMEVHEYLDELFENATNDADYFGELAAELAVTILPLFGDTNTPANAPCFCPEVAPLTTQEGRLLSRSTRTIFRVSMTASHVLESVLNLTPCFASGQRRTSSSSQVLREVLWVVLSKWTEKSSVFCSQGSYCWWCGKSSRKCQTDEKRNGHGVSRQTTQPLKSKAWYSSSTEITSDERLSVWTTRWRNLRSTSRLSLWTCTTTSCYTSNAVVMDSSSNCTGTCAIRSGRSLARSTSCYCALKTAVPTTISERR